MTVKHELETPIRYPGVWKGMLSWYTEPLLYNCRVLVDFLWLLINCIFNFSVPVWRLTLVVFDSPSKIDEFLHKMAISLKNCRFEQKNHSFLANWSDWGLSSQHLLTVEANSSDYLFLHCTALQYLLVGLRPPSTSFIIWLRLTMPAVSLS